MKDRRNKRESPATRTVAKDKPRPRHAPVHDLLVDTLVLVRGGDLEQLLATLGVHWQVHGEGVLREHWLVVVHVADGDLHLSLL